jgi:hypothetical protein
MGNAILTAAMTLACKCANLVAAAEAMSAREGPGLPALAAAAMSASSCVRTHLRRCETSTAVSMTAAAKGPHLGRCKAAAMAAPAAFSAREHRGKVTAPVAAAMTAAAGKDRTSTAAATAVRVTPAAGKDRSSAPTAAVRVTSTTAVMGIAAATTVVAAGLRCSDASNREGRDACCEE